MKRALSLLLNVATVATALVSPPAVQLPPTQFKVKLRFGPALLPVDPTLANIIDLMGNVAQSGFYGQVQPRTYTSPLYPQVQIMSHTTTEARFLLWGVYLAATEMINFSRFNGVAVDLNWNGGLVGKIDLMLRTNSELSGAIVNGSQSATDNSRQLSLASISNNTTPESVERRNVPPIQVVKATNSTDGISTINPVETSSTASPAISMWPSHTPTNPSPPSALSIDFSTVTRAKRLRRNEVFLTFFAAMLHIAPYPAGNPLAYFSSKPPTLDLRVHMYEVEDTCLVNTFHADMTRENADRFCRWCKVRARHYGTGLCATVYDGASLLWIQGDELQCDIEWGESL